MIINGIHIEIYKKNKICLKVCTDFRNVHSYFWEFSQDESSGGISIHGY